jgi:hypothetical protein
MHPIVFQSIERSRAAYFDEESKVSLNLSFVPMLTLGRLLGRNEYHLEGSIYHRDGFVIRAQVPAMGNIRVMFESLIEEMIKDISLEVKRLRSAMNQVSYQGGIMEPLLISGDFLHRVLSTPCALPYPLAMFAAQVIRTQTNLLSYRHQWENPVESGLYWLWLESVGKQVEAPYLPGESEIDGELLSNLQKKRIKDLDSQVLAGVLAALAHQSSTGKELGATQAALYEALKGRLSFFDTRLQ